MGRRTTMFPPPACFLTLSFYYCSYLRTLSILGCNIWVDMVINMRGYETYLSK
uniref:Uncharacterized protein n=1 Tax=Rhizophora mucronata TaxID=61149 RepID=A0A2P2PZZ6_RHIMU